MYVYVQAGELEDITGGRDGETRQNHGYGLLATDLTLDGSSLRALWRAVMRTWEDFAIPCLFYEMMLFGISYLIPLVHFSPVSTENSALPDLDQKLYIYN